MKESPQTKRLEDILRSSKMVAGGFLGSDQRSLTEIIDNDLAKVAKSGFTIEQIVARMKEITKIAVSFLGNWAEFEKDKLIKVEEAKGSLVCPWPHIGRFAKRVTYVKLIKTGQITKWSDLNIHMIEKHNFFEGKGAIFRIEPDDLIEAIF